MSQPETATPPSENHVIASAGEFNQAVLVPHLRQVALQSGQAIFHDGQGSNTVYFPTTAILSRRLQDLHGPEPDVDMLGRFEVACLMSALSAVRPVGSLTVRVSGLALAMSASALRSLALAHPSLLAYLLGVLADSYRRSSLGLGCQALHATDQRLACWLLRAADRAQVTPLRLTQADLAIALGVQRTTLNASALILKRSRAIRYSRGGVEIADRERLIAQSCGCYAALMATHTPLASLPRPQVDLFEAPRLSRAG